MAQISATIPDKLEESFRKLAKVKGITISKFVGEKLEEWHIKEYESIEVLERIADIKYRELEELIDVIFMKKRERDAWISADKTAKKTAKNDEKLKIFIKNLKKLDEKERLKRLNEAKKTFSDSKLAIKKINFLISVNSKGWFK